MVEFVALPSIASVSTDFIPPEICNYTYPVHNANKAFRNEMHRTSIGEMFTHTSRDRWQAKSSFDFFAMIYSIDCVVALATGALQRH